MSTPPDPAPCDEGQDLYECPSCGERLCSETRVVTCPECGDELQNISHSRE